MKLSALQHVHSGSRPPAGPDARSRARRPGPLLAGLLGATLVGTLLAGCAPSQAADEDGPASRAQVDPDLARLLDPTRTPAEMDASGPEDFGAYNVELVEAARQR